MEVLAARIVAWFAAGLGKALLIGFAIFGVIALPVCIYQTVQIHGFDIGPYPIIGRINLVEGLQHKVDTAQAKYDHDIGIANDRYKKLSDETTKRTRELQAAGQKAVDEQKAKTDIAEARLAQRLKDEKRTSDQLMGILNNAKPGDERPLGPVVLQYLDRLRGR